MGKDEATANVIKSSTGHLSPDAHVSEFPHHLVSPRLGSGDAAGVLGTGPRTLSKDGEAEGQAISLELPRTDP